jgi:YVTN family beta-propeller protein
MHAAPGRGIIVSMNRSVLPLLLALPLAAQDSGAPVRGVTDPGTVTTRQEITPAGVQAVFQGRVYGVTFGADAGEIYVLQAKGIYRMDWKANRMLSHAALKGRMGLQGISYNPAAQNALVAYADAGGRVHLAASSSNSAAAVGTNIGKTNAGAVATNGKLAVVPLISQNQVAVVDLAAARTAGTVDTGIAPFGAAINREGTVAYVTNWGGRVPRNGDLTAKAGLAESADLVVVDARGIASTGTVTRVDLARMAATDTIPVGLHPTAVAWDQPRQRLYVANSNKDSVSVIDTQSNRVLRTIELQPFPVRAAGIAPTALAVSTDGSRLYVACGGINAVAVVSTGEGRTLGLIPTGWYPDSVSLSPDGKYLAVATLLGVGSGPDNRGRYVHANRGSVHVLPIPDRAQLAGYTTAVAENNHMILAPVQRAPNSTPLAVPERAGDASLIEHVVYIIKENRTYDQVLGDMSKGNGDPSLTLFGEKVTPNQHRLADQFVLLDNFYATGGNSGDGHQWVTQANETAYCMWPGYQGRSYPFDGSDPIAYAAGGFLWDAALARKKSVKVFGEYAGRLAEPGAERGKLLEEWKRGADFTSRWHTTAPIAALNRILVRNYPAYSTAIPDVARAQIFAAELKKWVAAGAMPNLTIVQLPSNHTMGATAGRSSPKAMVADNDYALGQIVEALTRTPFWKKMAIFVVEDDAQNGVDHVDGHRTVALAISPYTRRGSVDSTFYSHQSIVKTIELMLGLPTLSLYDLIAHDMRNSFQSEPDFASYASTEPTHSLFEVNPPLAELRGPARKAALESAKMRWDVPDAAPVAKLNRIVWGTVRGWKSAYPKTRQALFSPVAASGADDDDE